MIPPDDAANASDVQLPPGFRWDLPIAKYLPGRSDEGDTNAWRSTVWTDTPHRRCLVGTAFTARAAAEKAAAAAWADHSARALPDRLRVRSLLEACRRNGGTFYGDDLLCVLEILEKVAFPPPPPPPAPAPSDRPPYIFAYLGDREPSREELLAALKVDRDAVVAALEERIVEGEETVAEGLADLRAYSKNYDFGSDDDVAALWDFRFELTKDGPTPP